MNIEDDSKYDIYLVFNIIKIYNITNQSLVPASPGASRWSSLNSIQLVKMR